MFRRPSPIVAPFDLMARRLRSLAEVRASTCAPGPAGSIPSAAGLVLALGIGACDFKPPEVQTSHVFHEDLSFSPIPSEWVLAGKPQARAKDVVQANDDGLRAVIWECSAGKFRWYFNGDEFVHILEGSVIVSDEHGQTRTLEPGDVAYFQAGARSVWQIDNYVKKLALVRDNTPSLAWRARRKLAELYEAL